jgi:hypothetical protein
LYQSRTPVVVLTEQTPPCAASGKRLARLTNRRYLDPLGFEPDVARPSRSFWASRRNNEALYTLDHARAGVAELVEQLAFSTFNG